MANAINKRGPAGPQGAAGTNGTNGSNGATGPMGPTGPSGSGTGDVLGPVSSTVTAIALWGNTSGDLLINSFTTISNTGLIHGVDTPVAGIDAANKSYVDTQDGGVMSAASAAITAATSPLAPKASPAFTGTVTGITAAMVGLGSVSNALQLVAANNLSDLTNAVTARSNLGLTVGTNVQAFHANLTALSGLTLVNDRLPYANGSGTMALTPFTSAGRQLVDDATVADMRTTLGLDSGGTGDIWVKRTGDTLSGNLVVSGTITNSGLTPGAIVSAGTGGLLQTSLTGTFRGDRLVYDPTTGWTPRNGGIDPLGKVIVWEDDFLPALGQLGQYNWTSSLAGTGSALAIGANIDQHPGNLLLTSGATATFWSALQNGIPYKADQVKKSYFIFRIPTMTLFAAYIGMFGSTGYQMIAAKNGFGITFNNSATITAISYNANATASSTVLSGITAVTNQWVMVETTYVSTGVQNVKVTNLSDGTTNNANVTGLLTSAFIGPIFNLTSNASAARTMECDYAAAVIEVTRA